MINLKKNARCCRDLAKKRTFNFHANWIRQRERAGERYENVFPASYRAINYPVGNRGDGFASQGNLQPRLADLLNLQAVSMIAIPDSQHHLEPQKFRFALVIEEADSLRNSVVKVLKAQDWFVHGILRAEQALHISF